MPSTAPSGDNGTAAPDAAGEATAPSAHGDSGAATGATLVRFSGTSRAVHAVVGVLMIICILTAAVLYNASLALAFGHRHAFVLVHVWCGLAMPVVLLAGVVVRAYRDDLGRLNRFVPADWRWLRSATRRDGTIRVGKFNAGQKLNASLTGGSILVLTGTGLCMYFPGLVQLSWRSGATFVHDWFALGVGLLVLGHLSFALKDQVALRGAWTGTVPASWAVRQHAAWAAEQGASASPSTEDG